MLNIALEILVVSVILFGLSHGSECYKRDPTTGDLHYFGTKNVTSSGIPCQRWAVNDPHQIELAEYFKWSLHENYCRPIGDPKVIQCYTVDPAVEMEACDVTTECDAECYIKSPISGLKYYFGTRNITTSGIACQKWEADTPHQPRSYQKDWTENYCRPVGIPPIPQIIKCYTVDPNVEMEECYVTECDVNNQLTTTKTTEITKPTDAFNAGLTSEDYAEQTVKLSETTPSTSETTSPTVNLHETTLETVASSDVTPPTVNTTETTPPTVNLHDTTLETVSSSDVTPPSVNTTETTPPSVNTTETTPPSVNTTETTPPSVNTTETTPPSVNTTETTPPSVNTTETTPPSVNTTETTPPSVNTTETSLDIIKSSETALSTVISSKTTPTFFEATSTTVKSLNSTMESFNFTSLWTSDSPETLDASVCLLTTYDLLRRQRYWSNYYNGNLSKAEKESIIEKEKATIRKELLLDTTVLSSYVRKKRCANDKRYSAKAMGYVGIGVMVTVAGLIVIPDLISCFKWLNARI